MLRRLHSKLRSSFKLHTDFQKLPNDSVKRSRLKRISLISDSRRIHTFTSLCAIKAFTLSDIGEGIKEVVIKQWYVKEGDVVEEFDDICEVESDKAATTITSKYKGTIKAIYYEVDARAQVGSVLVDIQVESDVAEEQEKKEEDGGVLPGSDLTQLKMKTEDTASGKERTAEPGIEPDRGNYNLNEGPAAVETKEKPLATPAVRRLVRENLLNLNEIRGSGKQGRVLKEDVLNFIDNNKSDGRPGESVDGYYQQLQQGRQPGDAEDLVYRIEGVRKHMVRSMTQSNSIPTLVYSDEINVTTLSRWRQEFKDALTARNIKMSLLPFMIKAMSLAILKHPIVNSKLDENCEKMVYKSAHNIGFAVATSKGLYVPNIKNVRNLNILQITLELMRLQSLAHAGKLTHYDLSGGTISISNLGSIGGIYFRPIINPPEVVIGAIGRMQTLPRYNAAGEIERTNVINVSWGADHRIIDGAAIAHFSNTWKEYLENPATLLLGLV